MGWITWIFMLVFHVLWRCSNLPVSATAGPPIKRCGLMLSWCFFFLGSLGEPRSLIRPEGPQLKPYHVFQWGAFCDPRPRPTRPSLQVTKLDRKASSCGTGQFCTWNSVVPMGNAWKKPWVNYEKTNDDLDCSPAIEMLADNISQEISQNMSSNCCNQCRISPASRVFDSLGPILWRFAGHEIAKGLWKRSEMRPKSADHRFLIIFGHFCGSILTPL